MPHLTSISSVQAQLQAIIDRLGKDPERLKSNWCVSPEQGKLMTMLARIQQSQQILEVGTSIGYSGLCFLAALIETNGHLTTIDASTERQAIAARHFEEAGCRGRVTLLNGDALPLLQHLVEKHPETFDMVFLDAQKAEYLDYWRLANRLLGVKGLLLADNTLSHRRQMQPFIDAIYADERWQVVELPTDHGLLVARKNTTDN